MIDNMKPLIWYISRTHMPISISFFLNMIIQRVYLCYKSSIYYANIYLSFIVSELYAITSSGDL